MNGMRSVAELREIHAAKLQELKEAVRESGMPEEVFVEFEPRFWMTWEEWCEYVEAGESFDLMAKRERACALVRPSAGGSH